MVERPGNEGTFLLGMYTYIHNVPHEEHIEMAPSVFNSMWQWGDSKYGIEHVMTNLRS